jgi:sugar phosphate isomerase/epimerase
MMNRRIFIQNALGGAVGSMVFAQTRLGNVLQGKNGLQKIGLQLYTVRKEMEKDVEGTLAKVAGIGFKEVEFAGYFNRTPEQIKTTLKNNGLSAPSAHVSLAVMKDKANWQKTLDVSQAIGHKYLILAYLMPNERTSLDDYKKLTELLNQAGADCKKAGIQFGYHNHDFEFQAMGGELPFDHLLKHTDGKLVKIELDLYWIEKAKQSWEKYFKMYPGRFELLHVKDMDNTPKEFFTEVGRGKIDFKAIFAQAKKAGAKHYFVEQDQTPASPFDSIQVSYDYLSKLKF